MMEEDDLDSFFKQLKKELPPNPAEYLRESLEKATIDFDEMRKQDVQFNS